MKYRQLFCEGAARSAECQPRNLKACGRRRIRRPGSRRHAVPCLLRASRVSAGQLSQSAVGGRPVSRLRSRTRRIPGPGTLEDNEAGMTLGGRAGARALSRKERSRYVRYLDDFPVIRPSTMSGTDTSRRFRDRKGLRRPDQHQGRRACILMTTDPGDLVLDPTCGSGTTAYVAEQWGRRWITIDTSRVALALARQRLMGAQVPVLPARRLAEGRRRRGRAVGGRCRRDADRRHPPRVRLRAGAAHHAEVDRQQPRHQGGHEPRGDRRGDQPARRLRAALRQAVRGQARRCGSPGRSRSRACRRTVRWRFAGGRRVRVRDRGRRGPDAPDFEQTILDNLRKAGHPERPTARAAELRRRSSRTPASTSRRSAARDRGRTARRRRGSRSRSARSTAPSPVVRQGGGARGDQGRGRSTCSASSASPSTRRSGDDRGRREFVVATDEGFANVAAGAASSAASRCSWCG